MPSTSLPNRIHVAEALLALSVTLAASPARAQNPAVPVNIDAAAQRHPISDGIYGVASADSATLADLNSPLNRLGGNNTSRYNWQINADNRGQDWYFESVPYNSSVAGEVGDTFFTQSRAAGAQAMLTIPMVGWVARLGPSRTKLASFGIALYGAQTGNDWQWFPDAGNGVLTNGAYVTGNNPTDANVPADGAFQQGYMQHLVSRWGTAASGGLQYYILDNEPSIWHSTHRDVHPVGATMDEMKAKLVDYAGRVKSVDPSALVVAPEEWGWSGYLYSGYDQQWAPDHGWSFPDRVAHGGWDYLPWLLDQLRQAGSTAGQRLLDVFSVHYYPQGGEYSDDVSAAMQLRRNRSTRSLWDPAYVDETWIADTVRLVPRLKSWVDTYYPGTRTAITEYNWGAEGHINGATTQGDILGILGREGLDMATRWTTPDASTPTYKAMKLYRNYDGAGSHFGETSVQAAVANPDNVAAFAAERAGDGNLTIVVISKYLSGNTTATISLAHFSSAGTAQAWQLTSANTIARLSDVSFSGGTFVATLPPQSLTLFVVPPTTLATLSVGDTSVTEGNSGTVNAVFNVTLSVAASQTVTVGYSTADGTATAGSDYSAVSGTLTFPPGTTTRPISVPVIGDRIFEGNETFFVNLSAPVGATIADGQGVGTIIDDDPPGLSVNDVTAVEGTTAVFTVTLSPANPGQTVTVNYTTADGSAMAGSDYVLTSGTLTFPPGTTSRPISVGINADALVEGAETFSVNLSGAVNAAIADAQGIGTILDPPGGGDFNGDGKPDILWRNAASGANVVWLMNGTTISGGAVLTSVADPTWQIVGVADFNGDGKPDILWRNAASGANVVWLMNGTAIGSGVVLTPVGDPSWQIVATGDFNGDGKPDILWRNQATGANLVWLMNGTAVAGGAVLTAIADANWKVGGVGDFNGDGKPDILWRNQATGANLVWFMNGTSIASGAVLTAITDVNWRIAGVGDFNADGKPDILWRNQATGDDLVWLMNGTSIASGAVLTTVTDTNWRIVGPR